MFKTSHDMGHLNMENINLLSTISCCCRSGNNGITGTRLGRGQYSPHSHPHTTRTGRSSSRSCTVKIVDRTSQPVRARQTCTPTLPCRKNNPNSERTQICYRDSRLSVHTQQREQKQRPRHRLYINVAQRARVLAPAENSRRYL